MKKRRAVIDLGTNTFHLLIVELTDSGEFEELFRKRIFIKLAENGIHTIGEAPLKRALDAIKDFKTILDNYNISTIKAFGTAALRTASNGPDLIKTILKETGIQVQLIPGAQEAKLIYQGVLKAVDFSPQMGLIMDIGGGSVEFILADQKGIRWAKSFPIGVAVLYKNFHKSDPISNHEINVLTSCLEQDLALLFTQVSIYKPTVLIGASGTFDVLEAILCPKKINPLHGIVKTSDFYPFFERLIKTKLSERFSMSQIPDTRAEMIIVALILIHFILRKTAIQTISVSAYAMKEGMLEVFKD